MEGNHFEAFAVKQVSHPCLSLGMRLRLCSNIRHAAVSYIWGSAHQAHLTDHAWPGPLPPGAICLESGWRGALLDVRSIWPMPHLACCGRADGVMHMPVCRWPRKPHCPPAGAPLFQPDIPTGTRHPNPSANRQCTYAGSGPARGSCRCRRSSDANPPAHPNGRARTIASDPGPCWLEEATQGLAFPGRA